MEVTGTFQNGNVNSWLSVQCCLVDCPHQFLEKLCRLATVCWHAARYVFVVVSLHPHLLLHRNQAYSLFCRIYLVKRILHWYFVKRITKNGKKQFAVYQRQCGCRNSSSNSHFQDMQPKDEADYDLVVLFCAAPRKWTRALCTRSLRMRVAIVPKGEGKILLHCLRPFHFRFGIGRSERTEEDNCKCVGGCVCLCS